MLLTFYFIILPSKHGRNFLTTGVEWDGEVWDNSLTEWEWFWKFQLMNEFEIFLIGLNGPKQT